MKFPEIWISKGVAGSQWHWGLSVFGLDVIFGIGCATSTRCSWTKIGHLDIETRAAEPH